MFMKRGLVGLTLQASRNCDWNVEIQLRVGRPSPIVSLHICGLGMHTTNMQGQQLASFQRPHFVVSHDPSSL